MTEPTIFLLMIAFAVKHWLCDFVLQTPKQIADKGQYGARGGITHAATHGAFTAVIVSVLGIGVAEVAFLATLDAIFHYHIDWFKQRMTKGMIPVHPKFWTWLGFDQLLHTLTYIVIIALIH